jgi:hypothetical protein
MKLLFDESLAGFWITPLLTTSSWSRRPHYRDGTAGLSAGWQAEACPT